MVALVIVVIDERFDLGFEIPWQEVMFQQNPIFQSLVPSLDLALGLGMIWCAAGVLHTLVLQPFRQLAGDVAGAVVAEQP